MERVDQLELLEDPSLPADVVAKAYANLALTQRFLGNTRAILKLLRKRPIHRVLDIGCGQGALLEKIHQELGIDVVGFDIRPAPTSSIRIETGNAATDPLPRVDVAIAVCLIHHLPEQDIVKLIRNAAKSSRRLIVLDLVRHWMPLMLFRIFMTPFLHKINAADGVTSIKRSYTAKELRAIADEAVGKSAKITQTVTFFNTRQIIDIEF